MAEKFHVYLVGGAVRDQLLNLPVKDRDWVIVGATPQDLLNQGYQQVGKDFPVFLHPQNKEEYALARTERKAGKGYTGFICDFSADITLEQDLVRRDLTINAIAQDLAGNLYDPYHGVEDLEKRVLRHVSPAFVEDPLRVLRLMRFWARFAPLGFVIAEETLDLCREMVAAGELRHLSAERVWAECEKALASPASQQFFIGLQMVGALDVLGISIGDAQLAAMNARLQAAVAVTNAPEQRLARWLQEEDCAAARTGLQETLPLPKRFVYWLALVATYGTSVQMWAELTGEARWALLKACHSLREAGDVLTLARLMQVDDAIYAAIENARERVRALSVDTLATQYQGAALGAAIRAAQEAVLATS